MQKPMRAGRFLAFLATLVALIASSHLAQAQPPIVLVDEGHGQKFHIAAEGKLDLSGLAAALRAGGAKVQSIETALTTAALSHIDALVISGAFAPFSASEIDSIMHFLDGGGRLAVMLHIPFPLTPLLRQLHVDFSNGVIHEREHVIGDDPLNFNVAALGAHPLTRKVDSLSVFGAWALLSEDTSTVAIAHTSTQAWVDLNGNNTLDKGDAVQAFNVAIAGQVGRGAFVVFGDDAIFQNQFLHGGNATLARNLGAWLIKAENKDVASAAPTKMPLPSPFASAAHEL